MMSSGVDITVVKHKLSIFKKRVSTLTFALKSVAWLFTLIAFTLLMTNKRYLRLPVLDRKQLRLYVYCIPSYLMILPYMLITYLAGEAPNIVAERFFLLVGIILFMVSFIVGIINVINYDTLFSRDIRLIIIPILLLLVTVILILDFLYHENWFINQNPPKPKTVSSKNSPSSSPGNKALPGKTPTSSPEKKPSQSPEKKSNQPTDKKSTSPNERKQPKPADRKATSSNEKKQPQPSDKKSSPSLEKRLPK